MKSNKKQVIFFSLIISSCQILEARTTVGHEDEMVSAPVVSLKDHGLSLPYFGEQGKLTTKKHPEYSFAAPKEYATPELKKERKNYYSKLTTFKDVKAMSKEKRREAYDLALELGNYSDALFYLKHLLPLVEDKRELQALMRNKADIYMALGNYKRASEEYTAYLEKYPGAVDYESALYGYIFALNEQRGAYDQDQETTRTVIRYSEKYFLETSYKKYVTHIELIYKDCYEMLYASEKGILEFYIKQKKPIAAEGRYAYLRKNYYDLLPQHRIEILALGCDVAQLQGNDKLFNERVAFLKREYPSHQLVYAGKDVRRSARDVF